ncbi:unnamed protein product [Gongylonema pulchrum]|uniref:UBA domain-containing protein n=1 Tax=Gongylonema pulchrum TaxID=637853 RepID=A0A183EAY0_9BILA|nr:unnamed protein product [Gongylonema pulchrum]
MLGIKQIFGKLHSTFHLQVNMSNLKRGAHALFPPPDAILRDYFDAGYNDALDFLASKGFMEPDEKTALKDTVEKQNCY